MRRYLLIISAFALTLLGSLSSNSINAQSCATDCGWTGTSSSDSCVRYSTGDSSDCVWGDGGYLAAGQCYCWQVQGCTATAPWPASCQASGSNFLNPVSASCCGGGGGSTPGPTVTPTPNPTIGPPGGFCGDGTCNSGESCSSCSSDCGNCSGPGSGSRCSTTSNNGPDCSNCVDCADGNMSDGWGICGGSCGGGNSCGNAKCRVRKASSYDIALGEEFTFGKWDDGIKNGEVDWIRIDILDEFDGKIVTNYPADPVILMSDGQGNLLPTMDEYNTFTFEEKRDFILAFHDEFRSSDTGFNMRRIDDDAYVQGRLIDKVNIIAADGTIKRPLHAYQVRDNRRDPSQVYFMPQRLGSINIHYTLDGNADDNDCRNCNSPDNLITINVVPPPAWFQLTAAGSTIVNGSVRSPIPDTCIAPGCDPNFIVSDTESGTPGIAVHNGTADFSSTASTGNANENGWVVQDPYSPNATDYDFQYFALLTAAKNFYNVPAGSTINDRTIRDADQAGFTDSDGFTWIFVPAGPTTIIDRINLNNNDKAIIFSESDIHITDGINPANPNNLENVFFMLVSRGDISVDPSVGNPGANPQLRPDITGVFVADGTFSTGTNGIDDPLVVKGTVLAESFNLERNLGEDNELKPAEVFVYAPEFELNFPSALSDKHLTQREIIP